MKLIKIGIFIATGLGVGFLARQPEPMALDLPNRIPEAAPYITAEATVFPPPYEEYWKTQNNPGQCQTCHQKIFDEWNGSMMSNSWRDPVWRGAFLLLARVTSTNGNCDMPSPPDGTEKALRNPFAMPGQCASRFDIGSEHVTVSRPGSLLDAFCSRCHMPTNYLDNVPLRNVTIGANGIESAPADTKFNPTSDNHTGMAFATLDEQFRNTESGKTGIFCAICHSFAATRDTPYHNYERGGTEYTPAVGTESRAELMPANQQDIFKVADPSKRNLGYSVGAGAYRLSPHAIVFPERFGPLAANEPPAPDDKNTSSVFGMPVPYQQIDASKHKGYHQTMFVRAEMCAACHDVTNALPIKNQLGKWAGGFPIERTYTEWANSRYADRPGNEANFDPAHKRDCQSCHMQQEYGQPGTAQTLYDPVGHPLPIQMEPVATDGKPRPFFSHHFVGGNALVPRLIGKDVDSGGSVSPYPELSVFSYSSADHKSPYSRAVWTHLERKGAYTQQARMAWDRLRHVLSLDTTGPVSADAGATVPINVTVANTGSGHDFPTGFPEGRVGWLAVHAYDLATGKELQIHDAQWNRTSLGVGGLTTEEIEDPSFPKCKWELPPGSPDPYAVQFKAVASLGDGCPTLDLPYATALNMVTNADGLPIDASGKVIESVKNPTGIPQFTDTDHNGDFFNDSFLMDSRLRPLPHAGATRKIDRYSVVIPPGTRGPVVVSTAVYYQSVEAIVGAKFLGNMTDTNNNLIIEPCVLGGRCDGRKPHTEPAVVEGSPPVPMAVRNIVIAVNGAQSDTSLPRVGVYPVPGARHAFLDTVPKVFFSRPVTGVTATTFTLTDAAGAAVPAWVDPIGDGVWGLFTNQIVLKLGATYTAHLAAGICDATAPDRCTKDGAEWSFTVAADADTGDGDTGLPVGFSGANGPPPPKASATPSKPATPAPAAPKPATAPAPAAAPPAH